MQADSAIYCVIHTKTKITPSHFKDSGELFFIAFHAFVLELARQQIFCLVEKEKHLVKKMRISDPQNV